MNYQYRVAHDEQAKRRSGAITAAFPITDDKIEHEYRHLETELSLLLKTRGIEVACRIDDSSQGVLITLTSQQSKEFVDDCLRECLSRVNERVRGLCIVTCD